MDLRSTLNLPDADATIPMKANLPTLEPTIASEHWEGIYGKIQASRRDAPAFVLHDGPPYTNSPIHIGTAMNKILKDFVVKSRTMMGFRVPYVPGFDNHGLPIEMAVVTALAKRASSDRAFYEELLKEPYPENKLSEEAVAGRIRGNRVTRPTVIEACRAHAQSFIQVQSEQFQRLGVFGLWENPYHTMGFRYEAELVRTFARLVEGGYVYRGLRPTLWSPTSRTALADTEIVYQDHVSKAIYVAFKLRKDPNQLFAAYPDVATVIWTTTPWTIPANLACAFHPDLEYVVVQVGAARYLIAEALLEKVGTELGWVNPEVLHRTLGVNLLHCEFSHPVFDRPSVAVLADYVTTEDGTGVVHTAPSHGREDFQTGQHYGLGVPNTVDERGFLTHEAGEFEGVYFRDCDKVVVERLRELGALLDVRDYHHSYPHGERDGQPVIFRATEQWFVSMEHNDLRTRMLHEIQQVNWVPEQGINRIDAMVRNRPDWCISRQRPWGVGIPVFYGLKSNEPVLDRVAFEAVARLVEAEGSQAWFERDPSQILPAGYAHPVTGETEFRKETDTLDVWFDSGASSLCVLEGNVEPAWKENWPADLYLEGSDQHRGWFNTSLILGTALHGRPPYRTVVTHGFVNDEKGEKMSKRKGNVIEPVDACNKFGADVVRYWCASVEWSNDVPCGENLLKQFGESYRNVRNTLRFLIANVAGLDSAAYRAAMDRGLLPLDEWVVEQADLLSVDVIQAYERFDFGAAIGAIHNFCREQLSRFYLDTTKDRMYCEAADSPERRSAQAACYAVVSRLIKLVAPVLVHTAEECWQTLARVSFRDEDVATIHAAHFPAVSEDRLLEIEGSPLQARFAAVLGEREDAFAAFEQWKGTDGIKDSQDAILSLAVQPGTYALLRTFSDEDLALMFKTSGVELSEAKDDAVAFRKSPYLKCERSRLRRPDVIEVDGVPLTARDRRVLGLG